MKAGNRTQLRLPWLNSLLAVASLMICVLACRELASRAKGRTSDLKCAPDIGVVKGEMDAGVKVTLVVKNVGESGFINIKPEITTSEGEWQRSQDVQFDAGESKTFTYFFDEPTINATNIQCRVGVSPKAD